MTTQQTAVAIRRRLGGRRPIRQLAERGGRIRQHGEGIAGRCPVHVHPVESGLGGESRPHEDQEKERKETQARRARKHGEGKREEATGVA